MLNKPSASPTFINTIFLSALVLFVASVSILFCSVVSFESLVDASASILDCKVLSLVVLVLASVSILLCSVESALVLKVASLLTAVILADS